MLLNLRMIESLPQWKSIQGITYEKWSEFTTFLISICKMRNYEKRLTVLQVLMHLNLNNHIIFKIRKNYVETLFSIIRVLLCKNTPITNSTIWGFENISLRFFWKMKSFIANLCLFSLQNFLIICWKLSLFLIWNFPLNSIQKLTIKI